MKPLCWWRLSVALLVAGCSAPPPPETSYNSPLASPGAMFGSLPPQVQNTVRAETGSAEITNVTRLDLVRGPVYRIRFRDPIENPPLWVAQDGSVLGTNLNVEVGAAESPAGSSTGGGASGLSPAELPAAVVKTVEEKAPMSA